MGAILSKNTAQLWSQLHAAGVSLSLDGPLLLAGPTDCLTDELRALIRSNKPGLLQLLADARITTSELLAAASQVCDRYGDSEPARLEMRRECLALPPHLRADLLAHLRRGT